MKNGLLVCEGTGKNKNIGDYIQSLASELFFDKIDVFVEREALSDYKSSPEKTKLIMNGWFMHQPQNFPPSEDIEPLLISFHIVPRVADKMLTPEGIEYLKKHAPVGCRDTGTQQLLEKHGISCYFSGCLTLALGERYKAKNKKEEILFVDPYFEFIKDASQRLSVRILLRTLLALLRNPIKAKKIAANIKREGDIIKKWFRAAAFYRSYSNMFDDELLFDAKFIYHAISQSKFCSNERKLAYADSLMQYYADAKLVITSRIHCALPCLGVKTPVIFVTSENLESKRPIRSHGRFGGIMELFRVIRYTPSGMVTDDETLNIGKKITKDTIIENKKDYLKLKESLINECKKFVALKND